MHQCHNRTAYKITGLEVKQPWESDAFKQKTVEEPGTEGA